MKSCRICGFINKPEAVKCAVCQSEFAPETIKTSEHSKTSRRKPLSTLAEIAIVFGVSCVLMLPFLSWMDSVWWRMEYPILVIIAAFSVIFSTLFLGYTLIRRRYEKKQEVKSFFDGENQNSFYVDNNYSAETDDLDEEEDDEPQVNKDYSYLPFTEQITAISKQIPNSNLPFNEQMTVSEATEQMAKVLDLPTNQLRMTLAAMASRRLVVVCGENDSQTAAAIQPISALAGTEAIDVTLGENCADSTALFVEENQDNNPSPSQFLLGLCVRPEDPAICHLSVKAEATDKLGTAFADLTSYFEHIATESKVTVKGVNRKYVNISGDETIMLPANRRIFLRVSSDRQIPLDAELLRLAAWVEAKTFASREIPEETSDTPETPNILSFGRLLQLTDEAEKVYYLPEETWKRMDELCEYLEQLVGFRMDNKLAVSMEQFVGIYMASGGTEQEAADAVIASLILPQVLALLSCKEDRDYGPLMQFIDGHFGLENLPICADFLKKYGTI